MMERKRQDSPDLPPDLEERVQAVVQKTLQAVLQENLGQVIALIDRRIQEQVEAVVQARLSQAGPNGQGPAPEGQAQGSGQGKGFRLDPATLNAIFQGLQQVLTLWASLRNPLEVQAELAKRYPMLPYLYAPNPIEERLPAMLSKIGTGAYLQGLRTATILAKQGKLERFMKMLEESDPFVSSEGTKGGSEGEGGG